MAEATTALATVTALYVSAPLDDQVLVDDVLAGRYDDGELRTAGGSALP